MEISLYKKVPFDNKYRDVMRFENNTARQNFLINYYHGHISSSTRNNEKYFDIDTLYYSEDINYCLILDNESNYLHKYYFITNSERLSARIWRLYISVDLWQTHVLKVNNSLNFVTPTLYNSMCIGGNDIAQVGDVANTLEPFNITKSTKLINLIRGKNQSDYVTLIFQIVYDKTLEYLYKYCTVSEINFYMQLVATNKMYSSKSVGSDLTIKQYNVIVVPYNLTSNLGGVTRYMTTDEVIASSTTWYTMTETPTPYFDISIASTNLTPIYNKKYEAGFLNKRVVINSDNVTHKIDIRVSVVRFNIFVYMLIDECNLIDLTTSLQLPIINDNYYNYMVLNANVLEASNVQRMTDLTLNMSKSVMAGAMSDNYAVAVAGGYAAMQSYISSEQMQRARLSDLKNTPSNVDSNLYTTLNNIKYGLKIFEYTAVNDSDIQDSYNYFGLRFTKYLRAPTTFNYFGTSYNFRYWRFDNVKMNIEANTDIKNKIENILNNGVRIWYDPRTYLTQCNYLKEE